MLDQKKYMNIEHLKENYAGGFCIGDHIVVQEKIDGANFSIRYDEDSDSIAAYRRRDRLDFNDNLRGAWEWSQTLDKDLVHRVLGTNLILFGEWLVEHSVVYPSECYQKAYFFDVWDTKIGRYLPQKEVELIITQLGLIYVPVLYSGVFESWKKLEELIGVTKLGGSYGEGIVVKNQSRLNDKSSRLPFYIKIVSEEFCETKGHNRHKVVDFEKINARQAAKEKVETVVTEARIRKILHKFVDEGIIPVNWGSEDMKTIASNLGREVYYDCKKEEPELVSEVGELFGKCASSIAMSLARKILSEK